MLEVLVSFLCSLIMELTFFFIMKILLDSKETIKKLENIIKVIILSIMIVFVNKEEYKSFYTLIMYLLNIIAYKSIFKEELSKTTIVTSLVMLLIFVADLVYTLITINFISVEAIRGIWYNQIIANITIMLICFLVIFVLNKSNILSKMKEKVSQMRTVSTIIFLILIVIVFSILAYNLYLNFKVNERYILNVLLLSLFGILLYIFLKERDNYNNLSNEYDSLFNYVQTFEDWIEKEQINRHEYKNQLAVLRCLTKEKRVKEKIDEILEDNINIEGEVVNQLKGLPKGGVKGLMYYKSAIAQKNKIDLTVDVSLETKTILNSLSEKNVRILCKLIGIYFDNAIEAAMETKKKKVLIEIYELKGKVNMVFSNTFKRHRKLENRNQKGVSSKGKGRGNGLYFASKLLKENNWLIQKQDVVDKYYIQELIINKKDIQK